MSATLELFNARRLLKLPYSFANWSGCGHYGAVLLEHEYALLMKTTESLKVFVVTLDDQPWLKPATQCAMCEFKHLRYPFEIEDCVNRSTKESAAAQSSSEEKTLEDLVETYTGSGGDMESVDRDLKRLAQHLSSSSAQQTAISDLKDSMALAMLHDPPPPPADAADAELRIRGLLTVDRQKYLLSDDSQKTWDRVQRVHKAASKDRHGIWSWTDNKSPALDYPDSWHMHPDSVSCTSPNGFVSDVYGRKGEDVGLFNGTYVLGKNWATGKPDDYVDCGMGIFTKKMFSHLGKPILEMLRSTDPPEAEPQTQSEPEEAPEFESEPQTTARTGRAKPNKKTWKDYSANWENAVRKLSYMYDQFDEKVEQTDDRDSWRIKVKWAVTQARTLPAPKPSSSWCTQSDVLVHGAKLILWRLHKKEITTTLSNDHLPLSAAFPTELTTAAREVRMACRIHECSVNRGMFDRTCMDVHTEVDVKQSILCVFDEVKDQTEVNSKEHQVLVSWAMINTCKSFYPQYKKFRKGDPSISSKDDAEKAWVEAASENFGELRYAHELLQKFYKKFNPGLTKMMASKQTVPIADEVRRTTFRDCAKDFFTVHEEFKEQKLSLEQELLPKTFTGYNKKQQQLFKALADCKTDAEKLSLECYELALEFLVDDEYITEKSVIQDDKASLLWHASNGATNPSSPAAADSHDDARLSRSLSVRSTFRQALGDENLQLEVYFDELSKQGFISMAEIYAIETIDKVRELARTVKMKDPAMKRLQVAWQTHQPATKEETERRLVRNMHRTLRKEEEEMQHINADVGRKSEMLHLKCERQRRQLEKNYAERTEADAEMLVAMQERNFSEAQKLQKQIDQDDEDVRRSLVQKQEKRSKVLRLRRELQSVVGTILDTYDKDGSKSLDKNELREYIGDLFGDDYEPEGDDIDMFMQKMDLDGDGRASKAEIMKFLKRVHTAKDDKLRDYSLTTETATEAMKDELIAILNGEALVPEPEPEPDPEPHVNHQDDIATIGELVKSDVLGEL
eukprot:COSAG02_NODE_362_length_23815_cov_27.096981_8_plen_1022_part_00